MPEHVLPADDRPAARQAPGASDAPYPFTERELARLLVFRAAVDAGFYTDELGPTMPSSGLKTSKDESSAALSKRAPTWPAQR